MSRLKVKTISVRSLPEWEDIFGLLIIGGAISFTVVGITFAVIHSSSYYCPDDLIRIESGGTYYCISGTKALKKDD